MSDKIEFIATEVGEVTRTRRLTTYTIIDGVEYEVTVNQFDGEHYPVGAAEIEEVEIVSWEGDQEPEEDPDVIERIMRAAEKHFSEEDW